VRGEGEGRREGRVSDVVRIYVYGSVCVGDGGEIEYVLHVISFEENIRLSFVGISARDARVAVEVVYHHSFLVFGQRSVHDGGQSVKDEFSLCTKKKKGGGGSYSLSIEGKGGRDGVREVLILGGAKVTITCPSKNFCMLVKRCFPSTHSLVS
jgi:hypothetical protein